MKFGKLFWAVLAAAAAILAFQLFVPPVIGLSDQGDFRRTIGRFGYGPQHADGSLNLSWVEPKYVPNPNYRLRDWEQFTTEYLFIGAALLLNKVVSRDGSLSITMIGLVHALAFLAIFARFLYVTRNVRARAFLWIGTLVVFTDVGYVSYWNSFFTECASGLFALLLLTESVALCLKETVSEAGLMRWATAAVLLVLAKPQNAALGVLLALFCALVLSFRMQIRFRAWAAGAAILAASAWAFATAPVEMKAANTYNMIFLAIVPESRNSSADLAALGLDPQLRDYSATGAWSAKTAFPALHATGAIGRMNTPLSVVRFYLLRPTRLWRHIQSMLPVITSLRPEWCGNFEPSAGRPAGARSKTFALWSWFHDRVLVHVVKFVIFLLPIPPLLAAVARIRGRGKLWMDFSALLTLCCLAAMFAALFGDAWDNVRHLYLFNLLLDVSLLAAGAAAWPRSRTKA